MVEMRKKESSQWWWFDSHHTSLCSPWLQSTLGELDKKTKAMLKLIEQDADSFAQRAEMFYKKRPELINLVEDFYRTHRSLAERYDQLKSDSGNRLLTTLGSPFSNKYESQKFMVGTERSYDSHSETYDLESDSAESEIDDPEPEDETQSAEEMGENNDPEEQEKIGDTDKTETKTETKDEEVMKLREEIERLEEEKRIQKEQLLQKDEEKREVIRQLSFAMEAIKLENVKLRKCVARDSSKKTTGFDFDKLKEVFSGKFFVGSSRNRVTAIAL
ncbi:protein NETWORKED 3C-like [Mercurialis annua]|uniref:protein NETWORKED 3C-like n=1 Tax=Mercurialis annua TaxID=3986 RepID=UPI00215F7DCB|nr:protein NETWORKED 3C-like [Mercurialis annua]XP_050203809.1 protein NETWORKED 3C-like [Mercurialis annua]XP_050203810.1 protein NETWORKED 3C-like [Mercurialis annua]XP_050203811.1 protein NETWORKED 3C-like [Mercurialis annua]